MTARPRTLYFRGGSTSSPPTIWALTSCGESSRLGLLPPPTNVKSFKPFLNIRRGLSAGWDAFSLSAAATPPSCFRWASGGWILAVSAKPARAEKETMAMIETLNMTIEKNMIWRLEIVLDGKSSKYQPFARINIRNSGEKRQYISLCKDIK